MTACKRLHFGVRVPTASLPWRRYRARSISTSARLTRSALTTAASRLHVFISISAIHVMCTAVNFRTDHCLRQRRLIIMRRRRPGCMARLRCHRSLVHQINSITDVRDRLSTYELPRVACRRRQHANVTDRVTSVRRHGELYV